MKMYQTAITTAVQITALQKNNRGWGKNETNTGAISFA
jgi:hypothetical protein